MAKKTRARLDDLLVARGLADSLPSAKAMIMSGDVIVNDQRVDKPGALVDNSAEIRIKDQGRFVSRGGEKLLAAITDFGLEKEFNGKTILDVGASTGGFTDCLLQLGAKLSIALDVGTAQLHWNLRNDPRVASVEKTDIKDFKPELYTEIDWVVVDVSFTSLAKMIPFLHRAAPRAKLLLLVKPQFELPREKIPPGGVVKLDTDRQEALQQVLEALKSEGYRCEKFIDAAVTGRQGNKEIFVLASLAHNRVD